MQLLLTSDQSHTLYHPELDETYHSRSGAIGESQYVYIEAGLHHVAEKNNPIRIFEFGFGTGLNALLSWLYAEQTGISIQYDSIEKYPLVPSIYTQLNYGHQLEAQEKMERLHQAPWEMDAPLSPSFVLHKYETDVFDFAFPQDHYDLVYFDAFAPSKQAEVWGLEVLSRIQASMKPGGTLVTYCSQGQFKRHLKELDFAVESLPGPFKKKEITRAIKKNLHHII